MVETQTLNLLLQAFRDLHRHVRRAPRKHRRKFLPANPPEQITATQRSPPALGNPLQHIVALGVPVTVVDHFEVINVQQQKRHRRTLQPRLFKLAVGAFEEVSAVAALCEYVGGRQTMQLGFHLLLFGDVFGNADDDHRLPAIVLTIDEAFVAEPTDLAIGGDDAVFAIFHRALVQDFGEAAFSVFEVVGVYAVAPLVVVGEEKAGGAAENPFIRGADVQHLTGFPVKSPKHRIDADQQRAEQLFALAQTGDFALSVH